MNRKRLKKGLKKKIQQIRVNDNTAKLEKETRRLVSKANARLESLQRRYKKGTWASKKLQNRLSTNKMKMWTNKGKIKIPKNATKTQLLGLNKAINQFLSSQTSTKAGISKVRTKTIESLRETLSDESLEVSYEDAEKLYNLFGDQQSFNQIVDVISPSDLQVIILEAIQEEKSEKSFIKQLELYSGVDMNDLDLREQAIYLYEKYVL